MATDIQSSGVSLQAEITSQQPAVSGVNFQVEIGIPDIQVAGVSLQVEIDPPAVTTSYPVIIEVFELENEAAPEHILEAGTNQGCIVYTDHGLVAGDMIYNINRYLNQYGATEPGCRRISQILLGDPYIVPDLVGQTDTDVAYFYKWIDRTEYVKEGSITINKQAGGLSTASFTVICTKTGAPLDYRLISGRLVRITVNSVVQVVGVATGLKYSSDVVVDAHTAVFQNVTLIPLNTMASRRTINVDIAAGTTYGSIVSDMVDNYLVYEGIYDGTIDTGATLDEDWIADKVNVASVLDECAKKSGYQWYIDSNKQLYFMQDPASIVVAPWDIDDSAAQMFDVNSITADVSMDNYLNKLFCVGGNDAYGNQIYTNQSNLAEILRMKIACGGTGVWGMVHNDSALVSYDYKTAEAGTDTDTIMITGHGLQVGDCVYNITRSTYTYVYAVDSANQVSVEPAVTGQVVTDVIEVYPSNYMISQNIIKLQALEPIIVEFETSQISFNHMQKIGIKLTRFGIDTMGYYNIEAVQMTQVTQTETGKWLFRNRVTCVKRDDSNFSTQKLRDYIYYYNNIVTRKPGYNGSRGSINPRRTVSITAPDSPRHGDEWLDVSAAPAVNKWWDSGTSLWTA